MFRFNYEDNCVGEAQQVSEYKARLDGIFHTDPNLEYTVVELEGEPGRDFGWLPLEPRSIARDERINIIQHAGERAKQVSIQNNFVEYVGGDVVQYLTSTLPGSSGSRVLNDHWEVIALHHAGGNRREPTSQRRYFRNENILIGKMLDNLPNGLVEQINSAS
ncbi:MAG: serine protease [Chloroflexota bacterium]|nr:serine protease [Chloroflexota bacterium]MDQ5865425.1 serine protease [Chloroflexota bacterium]